LLIAQDSYNISTGSRFGDVKISDMRYLLPVFVFFFLGTFATFGQSTRDVGGKPPAPVYQSSKQKSGFALFKKKQVSAIKSPQETNEAFEQRMKAVAKQKSKEARLAGKPEAANKLYFGHKREPKKRPNGKKKYCKICQFAH